MPTHQAAGLLFQRLSIGLTVVLATLVGASAVRADDALLPDDALLRAHVAPLGTLYESTLVQEVWSKLQASRSVQDALSTVEAQNLQDALAFVEERLNAPADELYARLTAGGVDVAVGVDGTPWLLVVAHASDDQITTDVVKLAVDLAQADGATVPSGEHRGFTGYRLGDVMIAAVGPRLLIGSNAELLKATVDRLLDAPAESPVRDAEAFHISARLDLERWRAIPDVAEGLKLPGADAGLITLLGGWIDLLRRATSAEFRLQLTDDEVTSVVRLIGLEETSSPPLAGFWADADDEQPAPLLILPGTIYSTSWYRDYGALWDAREQLVTQSVVEEMERGDADAAAQFETLGSAVSFSDVIGQLGPRLRIVIAKQTAAPYDVELRNQLPAAALVVELKDEATFREMADPLARVLHLILSFEQKIMSEPLTYSEATLSQLSFPHTPDDVRTADAAAFNFRPTHTITRGHFILGSTPEIVRQVIDALDEQASQPDLSLESGVTSRQVVDMRRLAAALDRVRDGIVRQSVLTAGLDVDTAHHELDVFLSLLRLFDTKTVTGLFGEDGFEHRVRVEVSDEK